MSLDKREIAQRIVLLQEELSSIISTVKYHDNDYEDKDEHDRVSSLRLKAVVIEQEIDQLQKQFKRL